MGHIVYRLIKIFFSFFFVLQGWYKGIVIVNGKNLGRFWGIGPQSTLYVPKAWLQQTDNTVLLFDLHGEPLNCENTQFPCLKSVDTRDLGTNDAIDFHV